MARRSQTAPPAALHTVTITKRGPCRVPSRVSWSQSNCSSHTWSMRSRSYSIRGCAVLAKNAHAAPGGPPTDARRLARAGAFTSHRCLTHSRPRLPARLVARGLSFSPLPREHQVRSPPLRSFAAPQPPPPACARAQPTKTRCVSEMDCRHKGHCPLALGMHPSQQHRWPHGRNTCDRRLSRQMTHMSSALPLPGGNGSPPTPPPSAPRPGAAGNSAEGGGGGGAAEMAPSVAPPSPESM